MLAKTSLILTLIVSLLFATQARPMALPVEMQSGGCVAKSCTRGCCANKACCKTVEQQKTPPAPSSVSSVAPIQLATLGLRTWTLLLPPPPAPRCAFVVSDEACAVHTLPPLAVNCIRLI